MMLVTAKIAFMLFLVPSKAVAILKPINGESVAQTRVNHLAVAETPEDMKPTHLRNQVVNASAAFMGSWPAVSRILRERTLAFHSMLQHATFKPVAASRILRERTLAFHSMLQHVTFKPVAASRIPRERTLAFHSMLQHASSKPIDKVVLLILEVLGLGAFGIDRMYLGGPNVGLGIAKLLTFSGFGVWGIIDYVVVIMNAVNREPTINTLGMHYDFETDGVETAHALGIVGLMLLLVPVACCLCSCCCSAIIAVLK